MSKANTKDGRTRNWTAVLYPENLQENWVERLQEQAIPCVISPLHDRDKVAGLGTPKKPHYHVVFCFSGLKSEKQIQEMVDDLTGDGAHAPKVQPVKDLRGVLRYLTHMDDPKKAQYSSEEVVILGGVEYWNIIFSDTDELEMMGEILEFIENNDIVFFADLVEYSRTHKLEWLRIISQKRTLFFSKLLQSREYRAYKRS